MSALLPFLIIILLVLVNGLFVAAEFAIIGVRPSRIEQLAGEGRRVARWVHRTLSDRAQTDRYVATAQLGITMASLGLGMYGEPHIAALIEPILHDWFGLDAAVVHPIAFALALTFVTYLHVVLGEMVPKSLALHSAERTVLALASPMKAAEKLLAGPVRALNAIGLLALRLLRIPPPGAHSRLYSPSELELVVSESYAGGLLKRRQQELVANIFDFAERRVVQVMTPRTALAALSADLSEAVLLTFIRQTPFSRLPVYEGDIDNVIGILHLKDFVRQRVAGQPFDLRALLRPALVAPETLPVEAMLATFKQRRQHMAIVIDEHGGTVGVVTLEDLIEEVVGEVRDEFDVGEAPPIVVIEPGHIVVQGAVLLEDIEEYVPLGEIEHDVRTIGGLLFAELGRPPVVGDQIRFRDIDLRVEAVDRLAIKQVALRYRPSPELMDWGA